MEFNILVWIPKQLMKNKRVYSLLWPAAVRIYRLSYRVKCAFKYGYSDFFRVVAIEISTECNRRCYYCPNSIHGTPREFMSEDIFKKIIADLKSVDYTGVVTFHLFGEPLMDPRLPGFVKHTREQLPKATISVSSNGDFLTMELYERLIDAGMNEMNITIHDLNADKSMRSLQPLVDRHPARIRIASLHSSSALTNRGGAIKVENSKPAKKCGRLDVIAIDRNGNVLLCCSDYFHSVVFGNVNEMSVDGIWKQKDFSAIRKRARRGKPELEICRKCLSREEYLPAND